MGIALNARRIGSDYRTYVLMGDGEMAEGSVWEAAEVALYHKLDNLCAITDVNALGQSRHDPVRARWTTIRRALERVRLARPHHRRPRHRARCSHAFAEARRRENSPTMIVARTIKGKGVAFVEGKDGWHGKALKKGEEADQAIAELRRS